MSSFSYELPGRLINQTGDLYMCCSDYPHSEGTATPLADYEGSVRPVRPEDAPGLFGENVAMLLGMRAWCERCGSVSDRPPRHDVPTAGHSAFTLVDDRQVHYLMWGRIDAPPVVCLHGGAQTAYMYEELGAALRDRWFVCAPDLPAHGDSDVDLSIATATGGSIGYGLAASIEGFLDHLGITWRDVRRRVARRHHLVDDRGPVTRACRRHCAHRHRSSSRG